MAGQDHLAIAGFEEKVEVLLILSFEYFELRLTHNIVCFRENNQKAGNGKHSGGYRTVKNKVDGPHCVYN